MLQQKKYSSISKYLISLILLLEGFSISVSAQTLQDSSASLIGDSLYFYYFKQKDILYSTFTESGESLSALNYLVGNNILPLSEGEIYFKITAYIDASFPDMSMAINYASIQAAAIKTYLVQRYHLSDEHFVFVAQDKLKYKSCMGYTVVEMIHSKQKPSELNRDIFYTLNNTRNSSKKAAARYDFDKFIVSSDHSSSDSLVATSHRRIARLDAEQLTDTYASLAQESRMMAQKEAVLSDSLMQKTIHEFILMEYNVGVSGTEIFGEKKAFRTLKREDRDLIAPIALKVNVLSLAIGTLNIEPNVQVGPHTTLHFPISFNPWEYPIKGEKRYVKHLAFEPGARYWFNSAYMGHFVGLYAMVVTYNISLDGQSSYQTPLSGGQQYYNPKYYRYGKEDFNYAFGVSYGYSWLISSHLNVETEIGLGLGRMRYNRYYEGYIRNSSTEWKCHPSRVSVGISYLF